MVMICLLKPREPGKQVLQFRPSIKAWEPGEPMVSVPGSEGPEEELWCPRTGEDGIQLKKK